MPSITLRSLPGDYAICRLPADAPLPEWAAAGEFWAVTRTVNEVSVICAASKVPPETRHESGWRVFRFEGSFAFTETGILESVLGPLARAGISILAQSTFDTDYLLVQHDRMDTAVKALRAAGHVVQE